MLCVWYGTGGRVARGGVPMTVVISLGTRSHVARRKLTAFITAFVPGDNDYFKVLLRSSLLLLFIFTLTARDLEIALRYTPRMLCEKPSRKPAD